MLSVAEELGLKDIVTHATGDPEAWKHYLLMVSGRFTSSMSKNKTVEWFKETFLPMHWHSFKPYEQEMLRKIDLLTDEVIDGIDLGSSRALLEKGLTPKLLIMDSTNFFTYIEEGEELLQKGRSKEKRNDRDIINLALAVTQENIDKASENVHIIGSARRSQVKEMFQIHLEGYDELYTSNAGVHILGYRTMAEIFGRGFSVVVSYNPATHKNQKKTYEKRKESLVKTLDAIKCKMMRKGKGRKLTIEGAMRQALDAIPRDYRRHIQAGYQRWCLPITA